MATKAKKSARKTVTLKDIEKKRKGRAISSASASKGDKKWTKYEKKLDKKVDKKLDKKMKKLEKLTI